MMIYITICRCIDVKVIKYTYIFSHKKIEYHFFDDKTSGARPLNRVDEDLNRPTSFLYDTLACRATQIVI